MGVLQTLEKTTKLDTTWKQTAKKSVKDILEFIGAKRDRYGNFANTHSEMRFTMLMEETFLHSAFHTRATSTCLAQPTHR